MFETSSISFYDKINSLNFRQFHSLPQDTVKDSDQVNLKAKIELSGVDLERKPDNHEPSASVLLEWCK